MGMARPKKPDSERKAIILRIPVTKGQRQLIAEAAELDGADLATWVRPVILDAAKRRIGREAGKSNKVRRPAGHGYS
jgi:uncharacterized protein (DUF1778 family)